jgi:hypothetical protein
LYPSLKIENSQTKIFSDSYLQEVLDDSLSKTNLCNILKKIENLLFDNADTTSSIDFSLNPNLQELALCSIEKRIPSKLIILLTYFVEKIMKNFGFEIQ